MSHVIETTSLSRSFGTTKAVDSLELAVPAGSIYGFLGPNGSGKTTTIRMLLGLIRPDQGNIRLFGQSLTDSRKQILSQVGALVEMPSLYGHLTGRENLEVTRRLTGTPRSRINDVLELSGISHAADRAARTYSLGMKQRLGLALALLRNPSLIILDEPTNGLDPAGIREMRELITDLPARTGTTVFLSSHLLNEVEQIATVVGIINNGKLLFQGSLEELRHREASRITIQVDKPVDALMLLNSRGYTATDADEGAVSVEASDREQAADINRLLVDSGIRVYSLSLQKSSLEHQFLAMTEEKQSVEGAE